MLYMFLENGFEETEALATLDFIRRAKIDIKTVSDHETVCGAHDIKVKRDISFDGVELDKIKGIILPGGQPGSDNLNSNAKVKEILKYCYENGLLICAICAAPYILGKMGYLKGLKATAYPDYQKDLEGAMISDKKAVCDKNFITAMGMGASFDFGYEIVKYFKGEDLAKKIKESIFAD